MLLVFWYHEHESYLPIEVKAIVENANLYKKGKKVPFGRKLEDLVGLDSNGRDYWLEPPDIEFNLSYQQNSSIRSKKGYGLTYASEAIKEWYDRFET